MDRRVFKEMLGDNRFIRADQLNREQIILLDNISSHNLNEEVNEKLADINTSLFDLPPNCTHKIQALDIEILKVFKAYGGK